MPCHSHLKYIGHEGHLRCISLISAVNWSNAGFARALTRQHLKEFFIEPAADLWRPHPTDRNRQISRNKIVRRSCRLATPDTPLKDDAPGQWRRSLRAARRKMNALLV
jgi:hypothetical protein